MISIDNLYGILDDQDKLHFGYKFEHRVYIDGYVYPEECLTDPRESNIRHVAENLPRSVHIPSFRVDPKGSYILGIEFDDVTFMLYQFDRNGKVCELTSRGNFATADVYHVHLIKIPDSDQSSLDCGPLKHSISDNFKELTLKQWAPDHIGLLTGLVLTDFDTLYDYVCQLVNYQEPYLLNLEGSLKVIYMINDISYQVIGANEANELHDQTISVTEVSLYKLNLNLNAYHCLLTRDGKKYLVKDCQYNRLTKMFTEHFG